jgi:hypothetical protein
MMRTALVVLLAVPIATAAAQEPTTRLGPLQQALERNAEVALGVQGLVTIPDGTASDISITQADGKTGLLLGQIGTGFTIAEEFPLYLEGYLGYARYDPDFVVESNGQRSLLPIKWNTITATVGIGWSFALTERLQLRPIVNGSLGYAANDITLGAALLEFYTGRDLTFLKRGEAVTGGLGGSLVLAWYDYRPDWEFEVELRYSRFRVGTLPVWSRGLNVQADFDTLSLWARYRWPTGLEAYGRPVRWVAEMYHSEFLSDVQREVLGADRLTRIGGGIELDVGRWELGAVGLYLQRLRVMGHVVTGHNVSGWSVGLGMSF